jgi:hypothetical protein
VNGSKGPFATFIHQGLRFDDLPKSQDAPELAKALQNIEDKYKNAIPKVKEQ